VDPIMVDFRKLKKKLIDEGYFKPKAMFFCVAFLAVYFA